MKENKTIKGYQIINVLGRGGGGIVYLVQREKKFYALKKITELTKEDIDEYQKLLNVLYKIKSEYVIKYYESFVENDSLYIIMEYGGNTDLKKYIEQQKPLLIDEKIIKDIIIQICLGLKEIHKNSLIHRDLAPDNIFMDNNNKIKIGDFGVSKILTNTYIYVKSQVGKIGYFAPEMRKGEKYNNKVDIYSLGCIIYELFTLNNYFNIKNENRNINIDIYNQKWQKLIDLTLNEDYHKRPNIEEIYNYIEKEISNNKNEITCIYYKRNKDGINLLHDFKNDFFERGYKFTYNEGKKNINEEHIKIYVNEQKIKFNYLYESEEIGFIKIKFIFKKLLTSTAFMFCNCSSLISIDLSSFNTNNVINMNHMFYDCKFLESIDLSSFITNNVRNMEYMFCGCLHLKSIDLSSFITTNVTNMSYMFHFCSSLKSLDLSSFNTNNVNDMSSMLSFCSSLKSIDLTLYNTSNVTDMSCMFDNCSSLESLDLSSFKANNFTNMSYMFFDCKSLKSLDLSLININDATNIYGIFYYCKSLESLELSSFNINNDTYMNWIFKDCISLNTINANDRSDMVSFFLL